MSADGFRFEGRDVTANQLAQSVVWSRGRVQSALESGATTMPQLVAYCTAADADAQARRTAYSRKGAQAADKRFKAMAVAR